MISLTPKCERANAGPSISTMPPATPLTTINAISNGPDSPSAPMATPAAIVAPAIIWPSAPIFHRPIEPATATAKPVRARGVARSKVRASESVPMNAASNMRSYTSAGL